MISLYFSGTGNSEYLSKQFSSRMECNCYSIEEAIDFESLLQTEDTIAVCYPIYGSCVPRIMREFVETYREAFEQKKLIIFCTQMMFSGDGAKAFARLLPGCDSRILYAEHFNMPNNICNFFLFPVREQEKIKKKAKTDRKLELVCDKIRKGIIKKRGWALGSVLLGKLQNKFFPEIEEKGRTSFIADSDCTRCGLCTKCCPMGNLTISETGVQQHNNCILCYRCVNVCPKKAATVMIHTKPKRQYKGIQSTHSGAKIVLRSE